MNAETKALILEIIRRECEYGHQGNLFIKNGDYFWRKSDGSQSSFVSTELLHNILYIAPVGEQPAQYFVLEKDLVGQGGNGEVVKVASKLLIDTNSKQFSSENISDQVAKYLIIGFNCSANSNWQAEYNKILQISKLQSIIEHEAMMFGRVYPELKSKITPVVGKVASDWPPSTNSSSSTWPYKLSVFYTLLMPKMSGQQLLGRHKEKTVINKLSNAERVVLTYLILKSMTTRLEANSLVHRDFTPYNILYDETDMSVNIIDFNTTAEVDSEQDAAVGSPLYVAPEIFSNYSEDNRNIRVTSEIDNYGAAGTLGELFAPGQRHVFGAKDLEFHLTVRAASKAQGTPQAKELSVELQAFIASSKCPYNFDILFENEASDLPDEHQDILKKVIKGLGAQDVKQRWTTHQALDALKPLIDGYLAECYTNLQKQLEEQITLLEGYLRRLSTNRSHQKTIAIRILKDVLHTQLHQAKVPLEQRSVGQYEAIYKAINQAFVTAEKSANFAEIRHPYLDKFALIFSAPSRLFDRAPLQTPMPHSLRLMTAAKTKFAAEHRQCSLFKKSVMQRPNINSAVSTRAARPSRGSMHRP